MTGWYLHPTTGIWHLLDTERFRCSCGLAPFFPFGRLYQLDELTEIQHGASLCRRCLP